MDTSYVRHCLYLHRTKILLGALLALVLTTDLHAQGYAYTRKHLEHYDDKIIHYGFFFAAPITRFNIKYSNAFVTGDSASRIYSPNKTSFRVGFVANAYMTDAFDIRTTPSISLYSREVKYDYPGGTTRSETRESAWLDIPLLIKYKSQRRNNTRMYLLAGGSFAIETNVRKKEAFGSTRLSTNTTDFTVEYGIGFEQFFEYFKFSPEIRFSHGIPNMFRPTNNTASLGIRRLTTHGVTIYINFE
nr:porin family protein [uncultured Arsenicibacter sp.]